MARDARRRNRHQRFAPATAEASNTPLKAEIRGAKTGMANKSRNPLVERHQFRPSSPHSQTTRPSANEDSSKNPRLNLPGRRKAVRVNKYRDAFRRLKVMGQMISQRKPKAF
jgi:hypothetical protein